MAAYQAATLLLGSLFGLEACGCSQLPGRAEQLPYTGHTFGRPGTTPYCTKLCPDKLP